MGAQNQTEGRCVMASKVHVPPPSQGTSQAPQATARKVVSYAWAIIPMITFGYANPAVFLFAAARLRTVWLWLAFALYTALWVIMVALGEAPEKSAGEVVFIVLIVGEMFGGT